MDSMDVKTLQEKMEVLIKETEEYKREWKDLKEVLKNNSVVTREFQKSFNDKHKVFLEIDTELSQLREKLQKVQKEFDEKQKELQILSEVLDSKKKENETCEAKMNELKSKMGVNDSKIVAMKKILDEKQFSEWYEILRAWDQSNSLTKSMIVKNKVEERINSGNGIPDSCRAHRGMAWQAISGCRTVKSKVAPNSDQLYYILLEKESTFEVFIEKDINRSFPSKEFHLRMLENDRLSSLFNVLKAYSNWDPSLGYCQGMNFLVGFLLIYTDQESAFWMLVVIMLQYKMVGLFQRGPMLPYFINHFDNEFKLLFPTLYNHFKKENVNPVMYLTEWFTTMYIYNLPIDTAARIWDVFLFGEGQRILFKVGLAILKLQEETLLTLPMEDILLFLKKKVRSIYGRDLIATALKIQLSKSTSEFLNAIDVECIADGNAKRLNCYLKTAPRMRIDESSNRQQP